MIEWLNNNFFHLILQAQDIRKEWLEDEEQLKKISDRIYDENLLSKCEDITRAEQLMIMNNLYRWKQ